ncbi:MAG: molecular chaperone HtpG [Clostridia bacterium]|nr:molecular chaperone HtpG [Clostridia bacterium]
MADNEVKKGGIGIELDHIFPIIKKWLYSEKEIFIREIVSNSCDAVTKLKRLISLGETKIDGYNGRIEVRLDNHGDTITVIDNGIGMTADELEKYLCQIALSGALDFIEKYEGENSDSASAGIIGHFGLGFYSAFMVSDRVDVITRSYNGSKAVMWSCGEDGEYELTSDFEGSDEYIGQFGTAVVMHINDEGREYLSETKLKDTLDKYCAFMPVPIFFDNIDKDEEKKSEDESEKPLNDIAPLWLKNPSDCSDDEYREFYRKVFKDYKEPLFWIHLKADYPLNFKGILFFPAISSEYESLEGQVKLYYNQVFVADNIKEVIPEYLLMLKGVLDCPELPLNVSRSYLQNSGYVSKISAHITKKVADKLNSMFSGERDEYEKKWRDIKTFVEYGCMRDKKFFDRIKDSVLFEKCSGGFLTLNEYLDSAKEKHENKVYYANDKTIQSKYISLLSSEGIETVLLDRIIDSQFITTVEMNTEGVKFVRVDSEVADALKDTESKDAPPHVEDIFKKLVGEKTKIEFSSFKDRSTPAILSVSEEMRRFDDMMKLYSKDAPGMEIETTLTVNTGSNLISKIGEIYETDPEKAEAMAKQVISLCKLSQRKLTSEELSAFLADSYNILEKY